MAARTRSANESEARASDASTDMDPKTPNVGSANLQVELAVERTILAEERTYDAWVRTGLASLASGIGAHVLLKEVVPDWLTKPAGAVLVLFAGFCFIAGVWRELAPSARLPASRMKQLPKSMLIVVNGILVIVAFAAFLGVLTMS
jgi:putative membrane protein